MICTCTFLFPATIEETLHYKCCTHGTKAKGIPTKNKQALPTKNVNHNILYWLNKNQNCIQSSFTDWSNWSNAKHYKQAEFKWQRLQISFLHFPKPGVGNVNHYFNQTTTRKWIWFPQSIGQGLVAHLRFPSIIKDRPQWPRRGQ